MQNLGIIQYNTKNVYSVDQGMPWKAKTDHPSDRHWWYSSMQI